MLLQQNINHTDISYHMHEYTWEMVRDPQIAAIVATRMSTPSETAQALIQAALAGGGDDNVSAIVAQVSNV